MLTLFDIDSSFTDQEETVSSKVPVSVSVFLELRLVWAKAADLTLYFTERQWLSTEIFSGYDLPGCTPEHAHLSLLSHGGESAVSLCLLLPHSVSV